MKYDISNKRKTIVFLPTYDYLSNNLFLSFVNKLKDYNTIYINNDEYQMIVRNENIVSAFSNYVEIRGGNNFSKSKTIVEQFKKILIENKTLQNNLLNTIKEINPDLIITTSDMSIAFKGIKKYCDKANIPTVLVQPSFFDYEKTSNMGIKDIVQKIINIFSNIYPKQTLWGNEDKNTILFLWGKFFKNYYNEEKDIRIVGNPLYDNYSFASLSSKSKQVLKKELGIFNRQTITICTEAFNDLISDEETNILFDFYSDIINSNHEIFFIIKLHPRDTVEDIKLRLNLNLSNYILVSDEYSLRDIFEITDIQVSVASASSLEAILLNISVILINPNNCIDINDFFDNSVELRAIDIVEFTKCLDLISSIDWNDKFKINRDMFVSKYLNSLGHASLNIRKEIKGILND